MHSCPYQYRAVWGKSGILTSVPLTTGAGLHVDDKRYRARAVLRISADGEASFITFRRGKHRKEKYTVRLESGQVKHDHVHPIYSCGTMLPCVQSTMQKVDWP